MLKVLLASKGPYFEFICVTMPGLEPPLEESGYGPASYIYYVRHAGKPLIMPVAICILATKYRKDLSSNIG